MEFKKEKKRKGQENLREICNKKEKDKTAYISLSLMSKNHHALDCQISLEPLFLYAWAG